MNTTENNKIIAEFLHGKDAVHPNQYHENWNELMLVVEKIESLGYDTELVYRKDDGDHCFYINDSPVFSSQLGNKKQAVYNACIEFIKWHNNQLKQDEENDKLIERSRKASDNQKI